jgi:hypothetical protein
MNYKGHQTTNMQGSGTRIQGTGDRRVGVLAPDTWRLISHRLAASLLILLALTSGEARAEAGSPPPMLPDASNALPQAARTNLGLGGLRQGHLRAWLPFGGSQSSIDTTNIFGNRTAWLAVEIEDDFTAARLVWNNRSGANSFAVTDCAIAASSQLGAPGLAGNAPGVTPYDSSGTALTAMSLCSFGNAGSPQAAIQQALPNIPASAVSQTTNGSAAAGQSNVTLNSATGVAIGQLVAILNPSDGVRAPTTVTGIAGNVVTLSNTIYDTLPSGTTIYFLPLGVTVPAAANPPLGGYTYSDWLPATSLARRDGPFTGCASANGGASCKVKDTIGAIPANTTATVNSDNKTIALSQALTAPLPKGSPVRACQAQTTTGGDLVPNSSTSFASTTGVAAGMIGVLGASSWPLNGAGLGVFPQLTVQSVAPTQVTFASPLPANIFANHAWTNGTSVTFLAPLTANGATGSGTTLPVSAAGVPLSSLSSGANAYGVYSSNIPSGTTATVNAGAGTLTLSQALSGGIANQQPVTLTLTLALNADAAPISRIQLANMANPLPGGTIEGTGWPANDYIGTSGNNGAFLEVVLSPTQTIANGSTVQLCSVPIATNAPAAIGATTLSFDTVLYKKKLLLVRINIGGITTNANYLAGYNNVGQAYWNGTIAGSAQALGGTCNAGLDGVLGAVSVISDNANGCLNTLSFPLFGIEFLSPRHGVTIAVVGDSHFQGSGTLGNSAPFTMRAAAQLSTPALPVSHLNLGWGGMSSYTFIPYAQRIIADIQPEIVVIQGSTPNDGTGNSAQSGYQMKVMALASQVRAYGGVPVIATNYPIQVFGQTSAATITESHRAADNAFWTGLAGNDMTVFDMSAALSDPAHVSFTLPSYTQDGLHANDNGHQAAVAPFLAAIAPYLGK